MKARLVAAVLATAAATLVAPASAPPAVAQPAETSDVRLTISQLSPVLLPEGTLRVAGTIDNLGTDDLRNLQLRVYVDGRIATRSQLRRQQVATRGSLTTVPLQDDELGPNSGREFSVDVPVEELNGLSSRPSVHPLRLEIRGRRGRGSRQELAHVQTFLQWWPADTAATRIAWLWPLQATSERRADGLFPNDDLAEALDPAGRLGELLGVAQSFAGTTPVTWAVDPALVAAAQVLAAGYRVRQGDQVRDGDGGAVAAAWLADLRTALTDARTPVLALPYADPDVAALVHAGRAQVVGDAVDRGRAVLGQLGARLDPALAWPPDGQLDRASIEVLAAAGTQAVVLATDAVRTEDQPTFTPSAAFSLARGGTNLVGLVGDGSIAELLAEGPGTTGERLAVQRFLAETAMITLERPNTPRDVVVTPPRDWAPRRAFARDLLALSGEVPWLEPVTLTAVARGEPAEVTRFLEYTPRARSAELARSYLDRVALERERVARLRAIMPADETALADNIEEVLLRAVSATWRRSLSGGERIVASAAERLDTELSKVRISTGGLITLADDTGRIPITIVNELGVPVLVRIRVESGGRLLLDQPDRPAELVPPGRTQIDLEGRAVQAGEFSVDISLLTPDGRPLPGAAAVLRVRSTAYGRVALVVTLGAFIVLVAASVARLVRRRRRSRTTVEAPAA